MKTNADYFSEGYNAGFTDTEKNIEQMQTRIDELQSVLATLVERLDSNWELNAPANKTGLNRLY